MDREIIDGARAIALGSLSSLRISAVATVLFVLLAVGCLAWPIVSIFPSTMNAITVVLVALLWASALNWCIARIARDPRELAVDQEDGEDRRDDPPVGRRPVVYTFAPDGPGRVVESWRRTAVKLAASVLVASSIQLMTYPDNTDWSKVLRPEWVTLWPPGRQHWPFVFVGLILYIVLLVARATITVAYRRVAWRRAYGGAENVVVAISLFEACRALSRHEADGRDASLLQCLACIEYAVNHARSAFSELEVLLNPSERDAVSQRIREAVSAMSGWKTRIVLNRSARPDLRERMENVACAFLLRDLERLPSPGEELPSRRARLRVVLRRAGEILLGLLPVGVVLALRLTPIEIPEAVYVNLTYTAIGLSVAVILGSISPRFGQSASFAKDLVDQSGARSSRD